MGQRTEELMRLRLTELERVVKQLIQPKSRVKLIMPGQVTGWLAGEITDIRTASGGVPEEAPYTGLIIATVLVEGTSCGREALIDTEIDMIDHRGCIYDLPEDDLIGVKTWGMEEVWRSREVGVPAGTNAPCHWSAWDRCCTPAG